ncbi:MAG: DsbA family protein [Spirochaetota bacterium]|nr:DsbA family protein [Spirochaetota bacterium]
MKKKLIYFILIISHLSFLLAGAFLYERERIPQIIPVNDKKITIHYPYNFNSIGEGNAPVSVIIIGRYESNKSKIATKFTLNLLKQYPGKVHFIYCPVKIVSKPSYDKIAYGAYAAGKLGKFWEYIDYFVETKNFTDAGLETIVEKLKLQKIQFTQLSQSQQAKKFYETNAKVVKDHKVQKVGTFIINGSLIGSLDSAQQLKTLIDFELKKHNKKNHSK